MAQRGLVIDKFVCVFIFQTSQRHNSSHMITCVLQRKQDIFFQTQKTTPTLAHDIALVHRQEVFYRHLSHIKPHFNPSYINNVISKHVLHRQSITFYRINLLRVFPEYFHTHSSLSTTDPCLLFEGLMPTDFIVDVDDVFIIFLFHLQTHTFRDSPLFIDTLRDRTLD